MEEEDDDDLRYEVTESDSCDSHLDGDTSDSKSESDDIDESCSGPARMFCCKHCRYTTSQKDRLFNHISNTHGSGSKEENQKTVEDENPKCKVQKKAKLKRPVKRVRKKDKALNDLLNLLNNGSITNVTQSCNSDATNLKSEGGTSHKCSFCDFSCGNRTELYRHIGLKHAHDPTDRYTDGKLRTDCVLCPFKGAHRKSLLLHLRTKHRNGRGYECKQCSYKTHHKSNFDRHVEVVHDKKKDVKCSECGFLTTRNYLLEKHILYKHKVNS